MAETAEIDCPFCGYKTDSEYQIMLHVETQHSEDNNSPFVARDEDNANIAAAISSNSDDNANFARCPMEGCGEVLLFAELENHLEMHSAEQALDSSDEKSHHASKKIRLDPKAEPSFSAKLDYALRNINDDSDTESLPKNSAQRVDRQEAAQTGWNSSLTVPEIPPTSTKEDRVISSNGKNSSANRRHMGVSASYLGNIQHHVLRVTKKSQLGPHGDEKQMPGWLVELLQKDGESELMNRLGEDGKLVKVRVYPNRAAGILPVLQQLLEMDKGIEWAFLCHPAVRHVSKLKREGGFCGYRNIQMLSSWIVDAQSQGHQVLRDKIPSIFDIQEHIESAWDLGINTRGREETGGIRGTRKYIGTPEAQAMFCKLGIACDAQGLKSKRHKKDNPASTPKPPKAYELLLSAIESYFANECTDFSPKIRCTNLPPIYFQHPGHSMTIVGIQQATDGSKSLIVFDPMSHDPPAVMKHVGHKFVHKNPAEALKLYRRGKGYLGKYDEFEILKLCPPPAQTGKIETRDDDRE